VWGGGGGKRLEVKQFLEEAARTRGGKALFGMDNKMPYTVSSDPCKDGRMDKDLNGRSWC